MHRAPQSQDPARSGAQLREEAAPAHSALLEEASGTLCWVSGGQGVKWFEEVRQLYHLTPELRGFIELCAASVLAEVKSAEAQELTFYSLGFDLLDWINTKDAQPSEAYLAQAPVSYPMIFLVQLCNYLTVCHNLGLQPAAVMARFKTCTGHSQGVCVVQALLLVVLPQSLCLWTV